MKSSLYLKKSINNSKSNSNRNSTKNNKNNNSAKINKNQDNKSQTMIYLNKRS